jgi:hypothetical protein
MVIFETHTPHAMARKKMLNVGERKTGGGGEEAEQAARKTHYPILSRQRQDTCFSSKF